MNVKELKYGECMDVWKKNLPEPGHGIYVKCDKSCQRREKTIRVILPVFEYHLVRETYRYFEHRC